MNISINSSYTHRFPRDVKSVNTLSGSCEILFQESSLCSRRIGECETTHQLVLSASITVQLREPYHSNVIAEKLVK